MLGTIRVVKKTIVVVSSLVTSMAFLHRQSVVESQTVLVDVGEVANLWLDLIPALERVKLD